MVLLLFFFRVLACVFPSSFCQLNDGIIAIYGKDTKNE